MNGLGRSNLGRVFHLTDDDGYGEWRVLLVGNDLGLFLGRKNMFVGGVTGSIRALTAQHGYYFHWESACNAGVGSE